MHPLNQTSTARQEYALTSGRKIGQAVYAGVFLIGAGVFLKNAIDPIGRGFALVVGGICLILGLMLVVQAWTSRLILDGDRIEVRSAFRSHGASRAEIKGLRKIKNQYGSWTRVYLNHNLGSFSVSDYFDDDGALEEWFKGLPNLDEVDAEEITKEVSLQESPRLESPRQESPRLEEDNAERAFDVAKAWAIGLSVLAGAASVPVIFVSYAPVYKISLVVMLACPIAAILLLRRFPHLFALGKRKPDPRAELSFVIVFPGMGVLFSYLTSNDPTHLVNVAQLLYWMLAVFVILLIALFPSFWKSPSRWAILAVLTIVGGAYSMGLVNSADTLLDHSAPRPYATWVLKKSESHTSKGTQYFISVAPWGPIRYPEEVGVPMRTFDKTRVGDRVCYGLHSGFLHASWYSSISCTDLPEPSTPQHIRVR